MTQNHLTRYKRIDYVDHPGCSGCAWRHGSGLRGGIKLCFLAGAIGTGLLEPGTGFPTMRGPEWKSSGMF